MKANYIRVLIIRGPIVVLVIFLLCTPLSAANDKLRHFGVSSLFGAAGESILHYTTDLNDFGLIGYGTALGTLPGLIKEVIDSTHENNRFDMGDLAADIAGALIGALIANLINNAIRIETGTDKGGFVFSVSFGYSY
ncbi:hypothetical protein ACFLT9_02670 [Acidobacteriota bacterium]